MATYADPKNKRFPLGKGAKKSMEAFNALTPQERSVYTTEELDAIGEAIAKALGKRYVYVALRKRVLEEPDSGWARETYTEDQLKALSVDHVVLDSREAAIYKKLGLSGRDVYERQQRERSEGMTGMGEEKVYLKLGLTKQEVDQTLAEQEK